MRALVVLSACGSQFFSHECQPLSLADHLFSFSWCQHVDTLLMDMNLPYMRSGGNWLTWPFQVIEQNEIAGLGVGLPTVPSTGPAVTNSTETVDVP